MTFRSHPHLLECPLSRERAALKTREYYSVPPCTGTRGSRASSRRAPCAGRSCRRPRSSPLLGGGSGAGSCTQTENISSNRHAIEFCIWFCVTSRLCSGLSAREDTHELFKVEFDRRQPITVTLSGRQGVNDVVNGVRWRCSRRRTRWTKADYWVFSSIITAPQSCKCFNAQVFGPIPTPEYCDTQTGCLPDYTAGGSSAFFYDP